MGTGIVLGILCLLAGASIRSMHKNKKAGKKACGCNCPGCGGSCHK